MFASIAKPDIPSLAAAAVGIAAIGFGTVPFFAKSLTDAGLASVSVAFYRYVFAALVMAPFFRFGPGYRIASFWALAAGAAMGIGWSAYVKSIQFLPVSTAAILYMTYPMFATVLAWLFFGQRVRFRSVAASSLIFVAAALTLSPSGPLGWNWHGAVIALIAPMTFGLAVNILATKLDAIPPLSRIAGLGLGATIGLAPLLLTIPVAQILPNTFSAVALIGGICFVTALGPQLLYVMYAPRIGPAASATLGGLELPTALLIGWMVFEEPVIGVQIGAILLILAATVLGTSRRGDQNASS